MNWDDRIWWHRIVIWLGDRVPQFFRTRWPLKPLYHQPEDIARAKVEAEQLMQDLNWK